MSRKGSDPKLRELARQLGLDTRGDCAQRLREYAAARVRQWVESLPVNSTDRLLDLVAGLLSLRIVFLRDHAEIRETASRLGTACPRLEAQLRAQSVCADTLGLLLAHPAPEPEGHRQHAFIDGRGERGFRAYFTAWHEVAHLLLQPPQFSFAGFRRLTVDVGNVRDPVESVVDQVAGELAFYAPFADPACGTGGFFLAAYDFLTNPQNYELDKQQKAFLKHETFFGTEIVANTRRLCLMNLVLHGIGEIDGESMISPTDSLVADTGQRYDYVLANPPFGKKSSMSFTNEEGEQEKDDLTYNRQDFWATTSNKQLNFVQHIRTMLKTTGRAAVVVPDNVLFEGGAGETVRRKLLETTDLHTILRLPTGIFYANGVKANVLFFDNREASPDPWTREVWFYDYRTNVHHTLKKKPMRFENLQDFIACYRPLNPHERVETWDGASNPEGRWRRFSYDQLVARDKTSLDIFWLKDKSLADLENLPEPDELAEEIIENVEAALDSFRSVLRGLEVGV